MSRFTDNMNKTAKNFIDGAMFFVFLVALFTFLFLIGAVMEPPPV